MKKKGFILTSDALFSLSLALGAAVLLLAFQFSSVARGEFYASSVGLDAVSLNVPAGNFTSLGLPGNFSTSSPDSGPFSIKSSKYDYPVCSTTSCMTASDLLAGNGLKQGWVSLK